LAAKTSQSSLFVGSIKHGIYFANTKKEEGKRGGKTQLGKQKSTVIWLVLLHPYEFV
jgi:hypothetical protein